MISHFYFLTTCNSKYILKINKIRSFLIRFVIWLRINWASSIYSAYHRAGHLYFRLSRFLKVPCNNLDYTHFYFMMTWIFHFWPTSIHQFFVVKLLKRGVQIQMNLSFFSTIQFHANLSRAKLQICHWLRPRIYC